MLQAAIGTLIGITLLVFRKRYARLVYNLRRDRWLTQSPRSLEALTGIIGLFFILAGALALARSLAG